METNNQPFQKGDRVYHIHTPEHAPYREGTVTRCELISPMSLRIGKIQYQTWRVWAIWDGDKTESGCDHSILRKV